MERDLEELMMPAVDTDAYIDLCSSPIKPMQTTEQQKLPAMCAVDAALNRLATDDIED